MTEDDVMKEDHAQRMLESLDNPIWFALTTEHRILARSLARPCATISAGCFTACGVASSHE
jgi:hypothetical protein